MKHLSENSIPFFGWLSEQFVIYIIDNKILGFETLGEDYFDSGKAFFLLYELMQNQQTKAILPEKLIVFFEKLDCAQEKKQSKLFGKVEHIAEHIGCFYCFDLDIAFDFTLDKPVIFHNMFFEKLALEKKLYLSIEEAFLILANIVATPLIKLYGHKFVTLNSEKKLNTQLNTLFFLSRKWYPPNKIKTQKIPLNTNFNKFIVYYFKYIQWLLLEKQITPKQVLNYNGLGLLVTLVETPVVFSFLEEVMEVLTHPENISKPQLILYYAFLKSAYLNLQFMTDIQKVTILLDYYKKYKFFLEQLAEKLCVSLSEQKDDYWEIPFRLS